MQTCRLPRSVVVSLGALGLALGCPAFANPERTDWLVGPYIAPSAPIDVLDGAVSFKPSPEASPGEFNEAIGMFNDRAAAVRALDRHRRGGRIFAGFVYSRNGGGLMVQCGQTSSWELDWDEIKRHRGQGERDWESVVDFGSFNNFKYVGRQERVFAIATCLSRLPGMPPLRPIHPQPTEIRIEDEAYADAVSWLSSEDSPSIRGTAEQYRKVFNCLATQAARGLTGVGHIAMVRKIEVSRAPYTEVVHTGFFSSNHVDRPGYRYHVYVLGSVSTDEARERFFDRDIENLSGIWSTRAGWSAMTVDGIENPIIQMLGQGTVDAHMRGCRQAAGLFVLPPSRVHVGPQAPGCGNGN